MRLAAKLILLFLSGLLLIVAVFSYTTLRREKEFAIAQHQRYAAELADLMTRDANAESQFATQMRKEIRVRRVEFSATDGQRRPSVPAELLYVSEEITTVSMPDAEGRDRLYTYVPLNDRNVHGDVVSGAVKPDHQHVEVSAPDVDADQRVQKTLVSSLMTLVSVSGLSALVVYFGGVRMVGRPLHQLIAKVNRVADGKLDNPVQIRSKDELADLGVALNQMCERLLEQRETIESETAARIKAVGQLRHADRLRSIGRIAAGVAHEIGTPLNVVSGHAELIETGALSGDAVRESCRQIKTQSDRIAKIISNLLDFARERTPQRQPIDVRDVIESTIQFLRPIALKSEAEIHFDTPGHSMIAAADPAQLQQVLTNLINNAIESRESGAIVNLGVKQRLLDGQRETAITVQDNGHGIAPEMLEQIFEPFFTTKEVGQGTGLGLAISHGIIQEHGGELLVESQVGGGSTFKIVLSDHVDSAQSPIKDEVGNS